MGGEDAIGGDDAIGAGIDELASEAIAMLEATGAAEAEAEGNAALGAVNEVSAAHPNADEVKTETRRRARKSFFISICT